MRLGVVHFIQNVHTWLPPSKVGVQVASPRMRAPLCRTINGPPFDCTPDLKTCSVAPQTVSKVLEASNGDAGAVQVQRPHQARPYRRQVMESDGREAHDNNCADLAHMGKYPHDDQLDDF